MPPNLHRDPAALRAAAAAVEALIPSLQIGGLDPADLGALAGAPGGSGLVAEHDRLASSATRATAELADLAAGLRTVASATESAERAAAAAMRAVDR